MLNRFFFILALTSFLRCNTKNNTDFIQNKNLTVTDPHSLNKSTPAFFPKPSVKCSEIPIPEFDEIKVSLPDEKGNAYKDSIVDRIEKRRTIFNPCRKYVFSATFISADDQVIYTNKITMQATGNRWSIQPEMQDEVIVKYGFEIEDIPAVNKFQINKALSDPVWVKETKTGIIENVEKIWIHPFRNNQCIFTEVAPFPEVNLPLRVGKSWQGGLRIYNGWGDWNDSYGSSEYLVKAKEEIETPAQKIIDCWKIESSSSFPFGTSLLTFWFSKEFGFVRMNYSNYEEQKLNFDLIEIKEMNN